MKRFAILSVLFHTLFALLIAACAHAQTPIDTLRAERAKVGTPMNRDEIGEILNATALKHGWFLLSKPGGNHCPLPGTGEWISCDWLVRPDGWGFDVFKDQEGAGAVVGPQGEPGEHFASELMITPFGDRPNPDPKPSPNLDNLIAQVNALQALLNAEAASWRDAIHGLGATFAAIDSRLAVLEARPIPTKCIAGISLGIGGLVKFSCTLQF